MKINSISLEIRELIQYKLQTFGRHRCVTKQELLDAVNAKFPNTAEEVIRAHIADIERMEHSKEKPEFMVCSCREGYFIATNRKQAMIGIDYLYQKQRSLIDRWSFRRKAADALFPDPIKSGDLFFNADEISKLT